MVNIINEQQQANKELLNKIADLEKQLANKDQEVEQLKTPLQITIENVKENENPEIAATLMTLEQHFLPQDELTPENFVKGCAEWVWNNCESASYIFGKNEELKAKNNVLEEKIIESEKENVELEKTNQELEEALELEEMTSECHLEALETARKWRVRQSKEKDDNLEKASRQIELLERIVAWQNYVANKQLRELPELPALPRKENKFKLLSNKVKNRIKQVREITKEKFNTYILQKDK